MPWISIKLLALYCALRHGLPVEKNFNLSFANFSVRLHALPLQGIAVEMPEGRRKAETTSNLVSA